MENSIAKTKKNREVNSVKSKKTLKIISEEDIRRRAFEIYQINRDNPHSELDDWFSAERELKGSDK